MSDVELSERRLVRRLLLGEEEAFEAFFEDYFPRLYRFAMARMGRDADAAEEVVQATLCNAVSSLDTFRGEAALFTWLCTLCRREIGAFYKRRNRERRLFEPLEDSAEVRGALESIAASLEGNPEDELRRKEIARLVQATLDYLPVGYGNALEWKYALGLSVVEIAARLKVTPKAAESLLTRAREAFRDGFSTLIGGDRSADLTRS